MSARADQTRGKRGQTWQETFKSTGRRCLFLILGEEIRGEECSCYRLLDLETGTVTWVNKWAIDEPIDNHHLRWERFA